MRPITKYFLVLLCWIGLAGSLSAQGFKRDTPVEIQPELDHALFHRTDSLRDPIYIDSGLPYFGMPIRSNCATSGDFGSDTLVFCNARMSGDTLFIRITNPAVCCYYDLGLNIQGNRFNSSFFCSYDISPAHVHMRPEKQQLILNSGTFHKGDTIHGYISFTGRGQYEGPAFRPLDGRDKKAWFTGKTEGYFKCVIE